ncbi:hypothetical protein [Massilia sp. YIM B02443]|uniref:hypothetical protein n=1 Tax=Massilia sp. YIM B02443 TaxID=3050127 RepID=UPI0025B686D0|nr:hypothetical protein [Massilia sp. YIM B02443]MDN4038731.1 hypothetical protein [Massilia sp. YIM B02443]
MDTIKLNLEHGVVSVNSEPITTDEKGTLAASIAKLCSPPIQTDYGRTQYHLLRKANVFGKSSTVVIEVGEKGLHLVAFLFDLIEFFESSILESKVLKACEKSLNVNFISDHPSTAFLNSFKWGKITFFYDAKQGDLSLNITFEHGLDEPDLTA